MKSRDALLVVLLALAFSPSFAREADQHEHMQDDHNMEQMHRGHDTDDMHESGHGDADSTATGKPGRPENVSRTVAIIMDDTLRFNPDQITVKAGETIRFFLKNSGETEHEMVIGSKEELTKHAQMMRSMPDMQHTEPNMARLQPGQRSGIIWQFDNAGMVDFACLIPGHMEAGMVGRIDVEQ